MRLERAVIVHAGEFPIFITNFVPMNLFDLWIKYTWGLYKYDEKLPTRK